jgi:hypothetical protein
VLQGTLLGEDNDVVFGESQEGQGAERRGRRSKRRRAGDGVGFVSSSSPEKHGGEGGPGRSKARHFSVRPRSRSGQLSRNKSPRFPQAKASSLWATDNPKSAATNVNTWSAP